MNIYSVMGSVLFFVSLALIVASFVFESKLVEAICESLSLLTAVISFNLLSPKKSVK